MGKLPVVISGFKSIESLGWCNIWNGHVEEIEIIKNALEKCGTEYSTHVSDVSVLIYAKVDKN